MRGRVRLPGLVLAPLLFAGPARADGAFPDSMQLLLPADHPQELLLATNFGLVVSQDGGHHWSFICEESIADPGETIAQYQVGPEHRLFARSPERVLASTDLGCSWTPATGDWSDLSDLFADPSAGGHLFGLALQPDSGGRLASTLLESRDAAQSFTPLFQAPEGVILTGVENAARAPATVYLSATVRQATGGVAPRLYRSTDGGKTFAESDLLAVLGAREPRILAVDKDDPSTIYYRVIDAAGDRLAISHDGGQGAAVVLELPEAMSAFARAGGTLFVGTLMHGGWHSQDGGKSFTPWAQAPRLRALAERAGLLYGVADNFQDGFSVGSSTDGGVTWTPLLRFDQICDLAACPGVVAATCQGPLLRLRALVGGGSCGIMPEPPRDAAASDAGPDAAVITKVGGCACGLSGRTSPGLAWLLVATLLLRRRARARLTP